MAALPHSILVAGGADMSVLSSFLVSVVAGIAAYYICKWLDRHDKEQ